MSAFVLLLFLAFVVFAFVFLAVAFKTRRSIAVLLLTPCFMFPFLLGGYHAWMESNSVPWTLGYTLVAALFAGATIYNWLRFSFESKWAN